MSVFKFYQCNSCKQSSFILYHMVRNKYHSGFQNGSLRTFTSATQRAPSELPFATELLAATDESTFNILKQDMLVKNNFLTKEEEKNLFEEVEPYLQRLKYEDSHWDDAILGYRETERKNWRQANNAVLQRVRQIAFPPNVPQLAYVHVLDLQKSGVIKAHVDSVRFCGNTIAGLSLLSSAVMRLVCEEDKSKYADILLSQRSLYIMKNRARYEYSHQILGSTESKYQGQVIPRDRRISVICRNEPEPP